MLVVPLHDRNNLQWQTPKEGAPVYYLTNFFRKLHENEKKNRKGTSARHTQIRQWLTGSAVVAPRCRC